MQLHLTFHPVVSPVDLPIHHNHILQGLVYDLMGPRVSDFVHNGGFRTGRRTMRLFAFSRLLGVYHMDKAAGRIRFQGDVGLILASPIDDVLTQWATSLAGKGKAMLGNNELEIVRIGVEAPKATGNELTVSALSPVVVYSTLYRQDGSPYTCYFEPEEPAFNRLVSLNLRHKAEALGRIVGPEDSVEVRPLGRCRRVILRYKGAVIKGVVGDFHLSGPSYLLDLVLDAGLGAKNSQGFGLCVPRPSMAYVPRLPKTGAPQAAVERADGATDAANVNHE
ncbi:MAG: CRISPR-associated endoribonuclease Cas6 [Firmicutes bacterium]|nr:CRISPR-associated endoribonuclease Cas6 [Bacillota bacterium]